MFHPLLGIPGDANVDFPQLMPSPVLWIRARDFFSTPERRAVLGVCARSQRVWRVEDARNLLALVLLTDVLATRVDAARAPDAGACEYGARCVDFECPLNRTTRATFAQAQRLTPHRARALPANFETRAPMAWNADARSRAVYTDLVRQNPLGGIIQIARAPRRRAKG